LTRKKKPKNKIKAKKQIKHPKKHKNSKILEQNGSNKKNKEYEEHQEHSKQTQQRELKFRPDFMKSKAHKSCKLFKDQELKVHSLQLWLNHHDLVKMGFGSKSKS